MTNANHRQYQQRPGLGRAYLRALLLPRKGRKAGGQMPPLTAAWQGARLDPANLADYKAVCELVDPDPVPPLYPHVLVSPLHLNMLTHKAFPLRLIGSVHLRNQLIRHRPLVPEGIHDLTCRLSGARVTEKGIEVDLYTEMHHNGVLVWEELSTFFVRGRFGRPDPPAPFTMPEVEQTNPIASWHLAADKGKRYARVSGDYNPIHVSRPMARMFGFERDLIHGFSIFATALDRLDQELGHKPDPDQPLGLDVAFKGPVYLDRRVVVKHRAVDAGHRLQLFCGDNPRPCIEIYRHHPVVGSSLQPEG